MSLKALIFDVDGTIANTEKDGHKVAFNMAFKDAKLNWDWDEELYTELLSVTGGKERIKHYIDEYSPICNIPSNFNNESEFIAFLHKEKTKYFVKLMQEGRVALRIGIERLFLEAKEKGIILSIATTTTYDNVTALLRATLGKESIKWFDIIGAGDVIKNKKPASDIYEWVLGELGLMANECVAIEDSYNGVISSTNIGIKTIATINEYTKNHDLSKADMIVDCLGDKDIRAKVTKGNNLPNNIVDIDSIKTLL